MTMLRSEYPRPHFVREHWLTLNGEWDFAFDDDNLGLQEEWFKKELRQTKIVVPFCYQSALSTIQSDAYHPVVWYQRSFALPREWERRRVLIHFNAVDYHSILWVNGRLVGSHTGGYTAFSFDITDYLRPGENQITLRVEDKKISSQPRGKQTARHEPWAVWYTPVTGIWQSVWLEAVGDVYLDHVRFEPNIDEGHVVVHYWINGMDKPVTLACRVESSGSQVSSMSVELEPQYDFFSEVTPRNFGSFVVPIPDPVLWSPEHPHLYDVELEILQDGQVVDAVRTYVGMRKVSVQDGRVYLNNKPCYLRMVLDQGYWPDGIYTPAHADDIRRDVEMTKAFGFNGARKHQKIEDPYYYYYCDKLGLIVWCEMPAAYEYDEVVAARLSSEWQQVVIQHYNHPSIIAWVPINESWGVDQLKSPSSDPRLPSFLNALYYLTKSLDPTRLVISNDGWQHAVTDVVTIHEYTQEAEDLTARYHKFREDPYSPAFSHGHPIMLPGFRCAGLPIMITEFGGTKVAEHSADGWGYGEAAADTKEMLDRIEALVRAITEMEGVCGYCYTQLTDVEQEKNGLMTYQRQPKASPESYRRIFTLESPAP